MEKTAASASYKNLLSTFNEHLTEQHHRHLWLFLYSSRHAQPHLHRFSNQKEIDLEESNRLIDDTFCLLGKFAVDGRDLGNFVEDGLAAALHEFCFGIAYALHRKIGRDGFIDPRFESQLDRFLNFFDSLTSKEMRFVAELHELTHRYGFPITELWMPLADTLELSELFTEQSPKTEESKFLFPSLVFPKKGNHPKGVQISTTYSRPEIDENWDLAIFVKKNDKVSHIKKIVEQVWKREGKQNVGDAKSHVIALYVDRKTCSISHALSILRLQVDQLSDYTNGFIFTPTIAFGEYDFQTKKEMHKKLSSSVDRLKLSEGSLSKRREINKSNVRRSIGLYLWDRYYIVEDSDSPISKKSLIVKVIDELKSKSSKVFDFYPGNFNGDIDGPGTGKFGGKAESHEKVIREMELDLNLTECCVKNFEYLTPSDAKNDGKQNRKI